MDRYVEGLTALPPAERASSPLLVINIKDLSQTCTAMLYFCNRHPNNLMYELLLRRLSQRVLRNRVGCPPAAAPKPDDLLFPSCLRWLSR